MASRHMVDTGLYAVFFHEWTTVCMFYIMQDPHGNNNLKGNFQLSTDPSIITDYNMGVML